MPLNSLDLECANVRLNALRRRLNDNKAVSIGNIQLEIRSSNEILDSMLHVLDRIIATGKR